MIDSGYNVYSSSIKISNILIAASLILVPGPKTAMAPTSNKYLMGNVTDSCSNDPQSNSFVDLKMRSLITATRSH